MDRACEVSRQSTDPRTQVGCVIFHEDRGLIAEAANGLTWGAPAKMAEMRLTGPEKYAWVEHAERRAIYQAARLGTSTDGALIFVYGGFPCAECARAIVEAGIKEVRYHLASSVTEHWQLSYEVARVLFADAHVQVVNMEGRFS